LEDTATEDLQKSMTEMRNEINKQLGTNFDKAADIQKAVENNELTDEQVSTVYNVFTKDLNQQQLNSFNRVFSTATGIMNGTMYKGNNGYYVKGSNQRFAGMWNGGVVESKYPDRTYNASKDDDPAAYGIWGNKGVNLIRGLGLSQEMLRTFREGKKLFDEQQRKFDELAGM
jgi:hypothetical protein